MRTLKEISHDSYYSMENYHQLAIDFVQEVESFFEVSAPQNKEEQIEYSAYLGVLGYNLTVAIEIWNPALEKELSDMKILEKLVDKKLEEISNLNFDK